MTIAANSNFCNKFTKTFYVVESFLLYGYFQLAGILSFQKINTCSKKIFEFQENDGL
jgi:hypothetical protein